MVDAGRDVHLDSDVLVLVGRDRHHVAARGVRGVEAGHRDRYPVADRKRALLSLRDPDLRLGQRLRVGGVLHEVEQEPGHGEHPVVLIERLDVRHPQRHVLAADVESDAEGVRVEREPEVLELRGVDLEQLDIDHDLGLRLVGLLDDSLRDLDLLDAVHHHDRVQPFVRGDEPGRKQTAEDGQHVLHVRVREEEGLDDPVLVRLAVRGRVLQDHDRLFVEHLVEV